MKLLEESRIEGRPDLGNPGFGITKLKKFPPYIYSKLGGMLVHRVLAVEAQWYTPGGGGRYLIRIQNPALTFETACGQRFYAGEGLRRSGRSQVCALPRRGAIRCGRCDGTGAIFGRGLKEKTVTRADARRRIGCAVEVA